MLHSTREGLEVRTAAEADRQGEIWGEVDGSPPRTGSENPKPRWTGEGQQLILSNPNGLGAELPLPHVLINVWRWAGTISQVKVMHALCGFNCVVVNFVKFFHDKLQIRANMRSSCETPEQGGQAQQGGHQQQDVGEKLKNRGADHAISRLPQPPLKQPCQALLVLFSFSHRL